MSQKKNEGILPPTEIRVVGSYTDRLLNLLDRLSWRRFLALNIIKYLTTPFENGSVFNKSLRDLSELTAQL